MGVRLLLGRVKKRHRDKMVIYIYLKGIYVVKREVVGKGVPDGGILVPGVEGTVLPGGVGEN